MPGIADIISFTVNPALARFCIPSDASVALKLVVESSSIACFSNFSNSPPTAPVSAFTLLILDSKSTATFTAPAPTAASGTVSPFVSVVPTPVIAPPKASILVLDSFVSSKNVANCCFALIKPALYLL